MHSPLPAHAATLTLGSDRTDADQQEEAEAQGEQERPGAGAEPVQEGRRREPCERRGRQGRRPGGRRDPRDLRGRELVQVMQGEAAPGHSRAEDPQGSGPSWASTSPQSHGLSHPWDTCMQGPTDGG